MKRNEILHAKSAAEVILKLMQEDNPNWNFQLEPLPGETGIRIRYTNENGEVKQEWIELE